MHAKSEENIRKKIIGFLQHTAPTKDWILKREYIPHMAATVDAIYKEKSQWMNKNDVGFLIYVFVNKIVNENNPANLDEYKNLSEITNINTKADELLSIIKSIPRDEYIYFPLPKFSIDIPIHIPLENGCELIAIESDNVEQKKPSALILQIPGGVKYYFKSKIHGYLGHSAKGVGYNLALSQLKHFLERGYSLGFFETKISWGFPQIERSVSRVYGWHTYTELGESERLQKELPLDISHLLGRIGLSTSKGFDNTKSMVDNCSLVTDLISSLNQLCSATGKIGNRIRSASEWLFNSYAAEDDCMKLLQVCIGLESIYGEDSSGEGLTESLSDRCAYSIGTSHASRAKIKQDFRTIYKLRSKIVHGVIQRLSEEEAKFLQTGEILLRKSLHKEMLLQE
ncbi:hypothetical protein DZ929_006005 [Pseudomonas aeruginosa]|uniref:HEPN domain-containing protein n=1 Tax=Pseudomonas aeruginosa TaxID=287 RepID=UPI00104F7991|nr:HEPN domain-containing protein [Pseudomonas aeruginosa]EJB8403820.1 hypothetical protein [Pseudomonas aeruginosa]MBG3950018.1 hypothetical protein [Pseudomonas aeruginosa]MBG6299610.1 hypothetical protein [Pseudomonas aeruginosa]MBH4017022.1 hypothetical protein [Pseudomonas aeruginosa]MBH4391805.1 hypothetical protein [Pseudomonas aeruginosa]